MSLMFDPYIAQIVCLICITPVTLYCFYAGYIKENKQRIHTIAFWLWLDFLIVTVITITNLRQYPFFNIVSWLLVIVAAVLFVLLAKESIVLKRIFIIFSTLIGLLVIGVATLFFYSYFFIDSPFDDKKFDKQVWLKFEKVYDMDNPRGQMVSDLIDNFLKKGMNKQEVVKILGKPDFEKSENVFKYNLGMWSGYRVDCDSLDIEFDKTNRLKKIYTVQH